MSSTPQQLKKALLASGFEVFRTLPTEVVLAERVRENLILDSGVRIAPLEGGKLQVRLVLRAQKADFPNDDEAALFERVRKLAEPAITKGFAEQSTGVRAVSDPGDATRTIDTFYEVFLSQDVASVEDAVPVLKLALSLEKAVGHHA
ncbi:MAG: hypothetical protein U0270_32430 [Labilithrix sp.]